MPKYLDTYKTVNFPFGTNGKHYFYVFQYLAHDSIKQQWKYKYKKAIEALWTRVYASDINSKKTLICSG